MQVNSIPIDKPTDWCYCVYPDNLLFTEKGTYDPRCRSWYMDPVQRIKRGDQAKVIQNDPYESAAGGGVFVTYTKHTQVTPENKDAVVAIDINPGWKVLDQMLRDQQDLSYYFIVNLKNQVVAHKLTQE